MGEKGRIERLKDVEVRLIAELMKNSRRSDRELAHAIGVTQPTVSRMIKKLEKEGVIREYTMIPAFEKLGYQIMGVTFLKMQEPLGQEEWERIRKITTQIERENPHASLIAVNGIGMQKDRMFITLYKDYTAYTETMRLTRGIPHTNLDSVESFLVNLEDKTNYRVLSMQPLSRHIFSKKGAEP